MAEKNSKVLLKLEGRTSSGASIPSLESKLFVCKKDSSFSSPEVPLHKPTMFPVPKSHVLGKVQNFLDVLSESNTKLMHDAKDNPENYDIEVLNGGELEYIEMDLMLGVADLHTPEAVAAAESAVAGCAPSIPLPNSNDSDDDDKVSNKRGAETGFSSKPLSKEKPKKRPKIVMLT